MTTESTRTPVCIESKGEMSQYDKIRMRSGVNRNSAQNRTSSEEYSGL